MKDDVGHHFGCLRGVAMLPCVDGEIGNGHGMMWRRATHRVMSGGLFETLILEM